MNATHSILTSLVCKVNERSKECVQDFALILKMVHHKMSRLQETAVVNRCVQVFVWAVALAMLSHCTAAAHALTAYLPTNAAELTRPNTTGKPLAKHRLVQSDDANTFEHKEELDAVGEQVRQTGCPGPAKTMNIRPATTEKKGAARYRIFMPPTCLCWWQPGSDVPWAHVLLQCASCNEEF